MEPETTVRTVVVRQHSLETPFWSSITSVTAVGEAILSTFTARAACRGQSQPEVFPLPGLLPIAQPLFVCLSLCQQWYGRNQVLLPNSRTCAQPYRRTSQADSACEAHTENSRNDKLPRSTCSERVSVDASSRARQLA